MSAHPLRDAHHNDGVTLPPSSLTGLARTDVMPPALRACVHEFGFAIVEAFIAIGITDPRHIRHLVITCWLGARSPMDRSAASAPGMLNQLDGLLLLAECPVPAMTVVRVLFQSGHAILPLEASALMVDASIEATGEMGLVSKREKHRGRLRAALRAEAMRRWPHLFAERRR